MNQKEIAIRVLNRLKELISNESLKKKYYAEKPEMFPGAEK